MFTHILREFNKGIVFKEFYTVFQLCYAAECYQSAEVWVIL